MVRAQVVIEESQQEALRKLARERGLSVSEVIRELIDREVARRELDRIRSAAAALRGAYLKDPDLTEFAALDVEGLDDER